MKIYSKKYDFPLYEGKPKRIICLGFVPRSGSNFLALKMRETDTLGYPLEYFSYPRSSKNYLKVRISPNGTFSFKWNSNFHHLPIDPDKIIFLDREDRWSQAKSYVIAEKTGDWLSIGNDGYNPSDEEITNQIETLDGVRKSTLKAFSGEDLLKLTFERVISEPEIIIKEILDYVES